MSLKPNDRIKIGDREVTILSRTAAGKHVRFELSDGTAALDLDSNDQVELLDSVIKHGGPYDHVLDTHKKTGPALHPVRVFSKEEMSQMDYPLPPEEGYEKKEDSSDADSRH